MPVGIRMSLDFRETEIVTKNLLSLGGKVSVGKISPVEEIINGFF
jgi:hypothetical protein